MGDGRRLVSGMLADCGTLPTSAAGLVTPPAGLAAHAVTEFDSDLDSVNDVSLQSGWNGPYLQLSAGQTGLLDGWGREPVFELESGSLLIGSTGSDGQLGGDVGYEADISVTIQPSDYLGDVVFRLFDIDEESGARIVPTVTGNERLGVLFYGVNAAGGTAGVVEEQLLPIDASGSFEVRRSATLHGTAASSRTQTELLRWSEESSTGSPTVWVADRDLPIEVDADPQRTVRVDQEAGLGQWATAWARDLASTEGLPVVRAEKRPMSNERATAVAAALGLAALLLCAGHHWTVRSRIADAEARVETLNAKKKQLSDAEKQLAELQKTNDKTKAEIAATAARSDKIAEDLATATRLRRFQRLRWLELVEALQRTSDTENWIREIRSDSGHATLSGLALSTAAVHRLASALESAANGRGWVVQPAQTNVTDQQLVEFEIRLTADDAPGSDEQELVATRPKTEETAP